jgi:hypothetical protein
MEEECPLEELRVANKELSEGPLAFLRVLNREKEMRKSRERLMKRLTSDYVGRGVKPK